MSQGIQAVPRPNNEPVRGYEVGSADRAALEAEINRQSNQVVEIPVIIGGREIRTGKIAEVRSPHNHSHVVARYHEATPDLVEEAVAAAADAWRTWSELDHRARASLYLRMADLLVGPWRYRMNAATMLGQSKTSHQAEIEAACEFADMLRFNAYFLDQLVRQQPVGDPDPGVWNYLEYRALEGFIFAVSPFNFTALGGNLAMAPAIMGNTIVWKPAETQMLSAYYLMELYREAGLPDGVVNMLPGHGPTIGAPALAQETLAGVHFTGSTATFQHIWKTVGGEHRELPLLSPGRRRDRRQELRGGARVRRCGGAGRQPDPGRLRVPGTEMLGGLARLPAGKHEGRVPRPLPRGSEDGDDGRPDGLRQLHGRRDRRALLQQDLGLPRHRARGPVVQRADGRERRPVGGLVRGTHPGGHRQPAEPADDRGNLRSGAVRLLLPGFRLRRDARTLPEHVAVRSDRRGPSRTTGWPPKRRTTRSVTQPATSTSTTSPPGR